MEKYASEICKNINERFPADPFKVIASFSVFDIDMLPDQSSSEFDVFGNEEILVLAKQFFPDSTDSLLNEWEDFKYEMLEIKTKLETLKRQLTANQLKLNKTSTEWTLGHFLNNYKDQKRLEEGVRAC